MPDGIRDPNVDRLLRQIPMARPEDNGDRPSPSSGTPVRNVEEISFVQEDGTIQRVPAVEAIAVLLARMQSTDNAILAELQNLNRMLSPFAEKFSGGGGGWFGGKGKRDATTQAAGS